MKTRGRGGREEENRGEGVEGKKRERKNMVGTERRKWAIRISHEVSSSKNCQEEGWWGEEGEKREERGKKRKNSLGGRNVWTGFQGKMEKKKREVRGGEDDKE